MPYTEREETQTEKENERKAEYRKILNARRAKEGLKPDCMTGEAIDKVDSLYDLMMKKYQVTFP